jgi:hypothetical protein
LANLDEFRYRTLLHLLAAADLSLVSVWSPTFVLALLAPLNEWHERLCHDLGIGTIHPPQPRRAGALSAIFRNGAPMAEQLRQIWPELAVISCWADAAAARHVGELRCYFPSVEIQPKGLLATEGMVSFPLVGRPAAVLAARSHFFEFEEQDGLETCRLAHQVERGGRYSVVLTTAGGLYRYRLDDLVEVVGFEGQCPLLRFLGKRTRVSDLTGEKLAEPHVREVLDRVFANLNLSPTFALVVPVVGRPAGYRLYVQASAIAPLSCKEAALRAALQSGLEDNPYYRHAVQMGQLAPVQVRVLPSAVSGWAAYERVCLARGQRAGNIKPMALDNWTGWPQELEPCGA